MCLTTKIEISRQTEFFSKQVKKIMQTEVSLALSVAKINNKTGFKDDSVSEPSFYRTKKKEVEFQEIYIETAKSQQVKIKRAMCRILANVLKWMHSIEIKFMLHLRCNMDTRQKQCLRNAMMKYK